MHSLRNAGPKSTGVQSIERAVAILKAFSLEKEELGVTELSQQLNLHKSTVSRLLVSLQREGLVEENPVTRKYWLGMALVTLGGLALEQLDVTQIARPLMQELTDITQETVCLSIQDRDKALDIAQVLSPRAIKYTGWMGRRTPLHCTSTGKVLLVYMPTAEQEAIIACGLPQCTPNTITSPDLLRQELARVREQGYAISQEEFEAEMSAVAAPIYGHTGSVIAAICAAGPAFRLSSDRLSTIAGHVQQTALKLSWQLGCDSSTSSPDSQTIFSEQKGGG